MQKRFTNGKTGLIPLEVSGLSYHADDRPLLDALDVRISSADRTVIMGPNGAGKSLFLRIIHGLIAPGAGDVRWGGRAMSDDVRRRQAMVFQRPVLLRRSVAGNMDFALSLRGAIDEEKRDALIERVGLGNARDQPARTLSGGEQQRLALARALALEPEVLMLDEPTANLDPASVLMIEEIVNEAHHAGAKIIFVTHDLSQARRLGDEIIFMHRGKILEQTQGDVFFKAPQSQAARDFIEGRIVT